MYSYVASMRYSSG